MIDDAPKTESRRVSVNVGVPQGSGLDPLLFSLLINDIGEYLLYTEHVVFADDTQIYLDCSPSEFDLALTQVRHDIDLIVYYSAKNGLKLNLTECKVMILESPTYVNAIDQNMLIDLTINGFTTPNVSHFPSLGVIFRFNLSWNKSVSIISSRVHAT